MSGEQQLAAAFVLARGQELMAEAEWDRATELIEYALRLAGDGSMQVGVRLHALISLGEAEAARGRPWRARSCWERGLTLAARESPGHPVVWQMLRLLADLSALVGDHERSCGYLSRAVQTMERGGAARIELVDALLDLHEQCEAACHPCEARRALLAALGLGRKGWDTAPGKRERDCSYRLAAALSDWCMFDEAEEIAERALRLSEEMEADVWEAQRLLHLIEEARAASGRGA
jgi:tetratricopeptide (TPR) repeat protein